MVLLKFLNRTTLLLKSATQYIFFTIYAVPVLRLKKELAPAFHWDRGFECFLLTSSDRFLKVARSSRATLNLEHKNYSLLLASRPDLINIFPNYRFITILGLEVLISEKLNQIPFEEALSEAVFLYRRLSDANIINSGQCELAECKQILAGICEIESRFDKDRANLLKASAERFLRRGRYTVGIVHGDFHSRNIMRDKSNACKLIDLDCVRLKGITEFDALYFALEQEWSTTGRLWIETLSSCFSTKGCSVERTLACFAVDWSTDLGVSFFLDRIGQESLDYALHYDKKALTALIDAASEVIRDAEVVSCAAMNSE
ncbi:MAG: hypothetical protein CML33_07695 [Rhodobacteraceae bacterium]|nr:hypothetical protein [Paracoccaceae bacterium]